MITNKKAEEVFLRIPLWVNKSEVKCRIGKKDVSSIWFGNYLRFQNLKQTDVLTVNFPMVVRTEKWTVFFPGVQEGDKKLHTVRFRGNTVVDLKPPLHPGSPLYQRRAQKYNATKAAMKKVIRNVNPMMLKW